MKTVGDRIKQARLYRKLSGQELADRVGYKTQSGIGNLEGRLSGGRGGGRLPAIARELNFPLQWFLEGPDVDDLRTIDPLLIAPSPPGNVHQTSDNHARYGPITPSPLQTALGLLERLTPEGVLKAIEHLEYLITKHSRNQEQRAGDSVPASDRKAA
jgi:transcriptional regulator with XRE-family HTH domain